MGSTGFSTRRTTDAVVKLGDSVLLRIRNRGQQDQGVRLARPERVHEILDPALQKVVAQVHHERRVAEERLGGEDGVRQPGGLVLDDVGELDAEALAVAGGGSDLVAGLGGNDDPDLGDAGLGHRLDAVEQHRLVGHRHELLGAGVGDRPQPCALAPGKDQPLELLHDRRERIARSRLAARAVTPGSYSRPVVARKVTPRPGVRTWAACTSSPPSSFAAWSRRLDAMKARRWPSTAS